MTVPSTLQFSVAVIKPGMKRSSWTQEFRRPVISMRAAAPRCPASTGGQREKINAARRDVFSNIARGYRKAPATQLLKKLDLDEMDLPQVGHGGIPPHTRLVLHRGTQMGIPLDPSPAKRRMASHGRLLKVWVPLRATATTTPLPIAGFMSHSLEVLVLLKDRSGQGRKAPLRQPREYSDDAGVGRSLPLLSRFPFPASRFLAEANALASSSGLSSSSRDHRVIGTKAPFRPVLLGAEAARREMALERGYCRPSSRLIIWSARIVLLMGTGGVSSSFAAAGADAPKSAACTEPIRLGSSPEHTALLDT